MFFSLERHFVLKFACKILMLNAQNKVLWFLSQGGSLLKGKETFVSILSCFRFTLNHFVQYDQGNEKSVCHTAQPL